MTRGTIVHLRPNRDDGRGFGPIAPDGGGAEIWFDNRSLEGRCGASAAARAALSAQPPTRIAPLAGCGRGSGCASGPASTRRSPTGPTPRVPAPSTPRSARRSPGAPARGWPHPARPDGGAGPTFPDARARRASRG